MAASAGDEEGRLLQRVWRWPADVWTKHPVADVLIAGLLVLVHWLVARKLGVGPFLDAIPSAQRPALYGACAIVVSLTGTLASVTVAQYLTGKGDRMRILKRSHGARIGSTWRAVFRGSFLVASMLLAAYALDSRPSPSNIGMWIFEAAALLAVVRFLRLSYFFGGVVDVLARDSIDADEGALALDEDPWNADAFTPTTPPSPAPHPTASRPRKPRAKQVAAATPRR
jgi:hypothetical protein